MVRQEIEGFADKFKEPMLRVFGRELRIEIFIMLTGLHLYSTFADPKTTESTLHYRLFHLPTERIDVRGRHVEPSGQRKRKRHRIQKRYVGVLKEDVKT